MELQNTVVKFPCAPDVQKCREIYLINNRRRQGHTRAPVGWKNANKVVVLKVQCFAEDREDGRPYLIVRFVSRYSLITRKFRDASSRIRELPGYTSYV